MRQLPRRDRREGSDPTPLRAEADPGLVTELVRGVAAEHPLPRASFSALWDAILLDGDQKDRLLAQALLTFTLRPQVEPGALPLHGLILLVGPPGTGKTSLARGLASRTAEALRGIGPFRYLEVEPHALANAGLGRSQQGVRKLLSEVIAERAGAGPLIVLLDEVETLAADRTKLSLEANPVDVHRATDAVLASLDQLAAAYPNLLFVATSNFAAAIDSALLSRADLVETIPLPGPKTAHAILRDALGALASAYPAVARLVDDPGFAQAAAACHGLDGRQIRKVVVAACALDKRTALDPGRLTVADLARAARLAQRVQGAASREGSR
jgi:SpoVK/Ycf46/Vps4 family AAA+-type ATPase